MPDVVDQAREDRTIEDPEGNTLEIYCDVPAAVYDWHTEGMGFIAWPLDLETEPGEVASR